MEFEEEWIREEDFRELLPVAPVLEIRGLHFLVRFVQFKDHKQMVDGPQGAIPGGQLRNSDGTLEDDGK